MDLGKAFKKKEKEEELEPSVTEINELDSINVSESKRISLGAYQLKEYWPEACKSIEDTGLSLGFINSLVLKTLYFKGELLGQQIANLLRLPFTNVTEKSLDFLKEQKLVEVKGGDAMLSSHWKYIITSLGKNAVNEILTRDKYLGPCPISFEDYKKIVEFQTIDNLSISPDDVKRQFEDLVISDEMINLIGPAVNAARSIFLFGEPGNGKSTIAERIRLMLGGDILIPYALAIDNQVIKVFDPINHEPLESPDSDKLDDLSKFGVDGKKVDRRWIATKRPMVMVGGELTLQDLDLIYNMDAKFYEAPLQLKSNFGILLIDDFGRQQIRPQDLLNRWIVPLEKRVDFLTLHTGKKIEVPFRGLLVFSTNLEPEKLVDEAFLRRIRFKLYVGNPDEKTFKSIFRKVAASKNIEYKEEMVDYLINTYYIETKRDFRACHPRDLVEQIIGYSKFKGITPALTKETIDFAANTYFVL